MKKALLPTLLTLWVWSASAQVWFQVGDRWAYYVTTGWNGGNWGIHTLTVEGDTLIADTVWKQVVYREINMPPTTFYVRAEGERVYHLKAPIAGPPKVNLLYDFSLAPGDTLYIAQQQWYVVLDTSTVAVGQQQRRRQTIRWKGSNEHLEVVEGIGMTGRREEPYNACAFLLLDIPFCMGAVDGYSFFFQCFRNAQGDEYSHVPESCSALGAAEVAPFAPKVWPNPAQERLWVEGEYVLLRLFDIQGRLVLETRPAAGEVAELRVGHLPEGVYLLYTLSANGLWGRLRVVFAP